MLHFTIGRRIYSPSEKERCSYDAIARPDRFNAKCRRVLHAAIMVEIYVANISSHPFSPARPQPPRMAFVYQRYVALVIGPHMDITQYFIFCREDINAIMVDAFQKTKLIPKKFQS